MLHMLKCNIAYLYDGFLCLIKPDVQWWNFPLVMEEHYVPTPHQ